MKMKGIILAGGMGQRLYPLTMVTNKHLLPVGKKPMIFHPIEKLVSAGIKDIIIVTGTNHVGNMIRLLGSGDSFGCNFTYRVQDSPDGIGGALRLCKDAVGKSKCVVILGDNMFESSLEKHIEKFINSKMSCMLLLKKVEDPSRFGIAVVESNEIIKIIEKPSAFLSDLCVTGIYMYDNTVFDKIGSLTKSKRGEYEISHVNDLYVMEKNIAWDLLDGWWTDAGTHESYQDANKLFWKNK
jgi:glucose-1-phosphate thymidylyltransferase